jgi:tetratricopeptide (TPR) repeat protein
MAALQSHALNLGRLLAVWLVGSFVTGSIAPVVAQTSGFGDIMVPTERLPNCLGNAPQNGADIDGVRFLEGLKRCSAKEQQQILSALRPQLAKQGNLLYQSGNFAGSESIFRQLIQVAPKDATLHYSLGNALYRQKKEEAAIASYRLAIQLNPKHALARNGLGFALMKQENWDEAIAEYREALKINPNYAHALANLGEALWGQGQAVDAIASLEQAKALFQKQQEFRLVNQIDLFIQHIRESSSRVS